MKHLPGPHQTVHDNYSKITAFLKQEVDRHMVDWNPEDPRDYIDTYLAEMEKVSLWNSDSSQWQEASLMLEERRVLGWCQRWK